MDRAGVERWVADYERVWRSPGTEGQREGPDEEFSMSSEVVAVDGQASVVRVLVEYHAPGGLPWRDLWVLRFADDGRCSAFEEWAFAPKAVRRAIEPVQGRVRG